jgi:predicted membrane protein
MNNFRKYAERRDGASSRLILGIFIVAVGALALIDNLGIFDTHQLLSFWPTIFIILGVLRISKSRTISGFFYGGVLLAVGLGLTLENLGYVVIRWGQLWPVFIILAGIAYILKGLQAKQIDATSAQSNTPYMTVTNSNADTIDIVAIMSGNKANNASQNFLGGGVTTVMGSAEIDLRGASIQSEACIDVVVLMGGIEIYVPNDWVVISNGLPIMGGIEDHSVPPINSAKRLIISGIVVMGGVEIKN